MGITNSQMSSNLELELTPLCYGQAAGNDIIEKPDLTTLNTSADYGKYLSYDHTTKEFTVIAPFKAIITAWVYQYRSPNQTTSEGEFYYNGTKIGKKYKCGSKNLGDTAGLTRAIEVSAGDTFYVYTPSTNGYPQQRIKIYLCNDDAFTTFNTYDEAFSLEPALTGGGD